MGMIQELFMAAFVAFVFSILVEKLACVTINGDEWKSKRTKGHITKNKNKSKKKVRFAVHDQIAIVVNNKLIKFDTVNQKQIFGSKSYDLKEVYLGANWSGQELMIYKELGLHMEPHGLGLDSTQDRQRILNETARAWLEIDDDIDDQAEDHKNENTD